VARRWRPLVRVAAVTGQELIDLLRLDVDEHVDWERGEIRLIRSKTQEPVAVPLGAVSREILEPARFRGGLVFRDREGKGFTSREARNKISRHVGAVARAAGVGGSFKALRTTAASWASAAGNPDAMVGRLLGYSRGSTMTGRYIDLNADDLRGMIARLDAVEMGATDPQSAPQVDPTVSGGGANPENPRQQAVSE